MNWFRSKYALEKSQYVLRFIECGSKFRAREIDQESEFKKFEVFLF